MATFAIPLALSGISALGGLFGNKGKKQTTEQTTSQNTSSATQPIYDSQQQIMRTLLMNQFLGRTEDQNDYFGGYTRAGLNNINQASNIGQENISNILAARGLGRTSAGGSALISGQLNRLNQQTGFLNQIPQLMDQRNRQNLLDASGFFGSLPVGQSSSGQNTSTMRGTGTDPGNPLGGAISSLGTTLGGLYGSGAFGKYGAPYRPSTVVYGSPNQQPWGGQGTPDPNYFGS